MLALRRTLVTALIAVTASVCAQTPAAAPAEGTAAPAFKLQDQAGKWHTLDQYKGKWVVLYFYPKDFTGGCTTQACELRDNIFAFKKADAVILGVSVDDVASHEKFAKEHSLPFDILADPDQGGVRASTACCPPTAARKLASRQTFLIGPDGKIVKHWAKVDPKGHSDMVLAEIKAHSADKAPAKQLTASSIARRPARSTRRAFRACRDRSCVRRRLSSRIARSSPSSVSGNMRPPTSSRVMPTDGVHSQRSSGFRIQPHQARKMRRDPRHPHAAGFLVPVLHAAARLLDLVRAHGGVADEHHAVVGVERAQQRPGVGDHAEAAAVVLPHALVRESCGSRSTRGA